MDDTYNIREPHGRAGHICVPYKDKMLMWGGYYEDEEDGDNTFYASNLLWVFCPLTRIWREIKCQLNPNEEPRGMSGATAAVIWDYLYLFGGYTQETESSHNNLYRISLKCCVWEKLNPGGEVPLAVDKLVSWAFSGKLYIFGGYGTLSLNEARLSIFHFLFDGLRMKGWTNQFYVYDPEKNRWSVPKFKGVLPHARAAHAATVVQNHVYVFGGRHGCKRTNDLHSLDMVNMQWSGEIRVNGPIPQGRSWHSLTGICGSMLLLYGGFNDKHEALGDCWVFNIPCLIWQPVELPFCKPRVWHAAARTVFDEVAIFGGCSSNILAHERPAQPHETILIGLSPRSLFRLCLDRIRQLPQYPVLWFSLPQSIQNTLRAQRCAYRVQYSYNS